MLPRSLQVYYGESAPHLPEKGKSAVLFMQNFPQAKNLLGQELDWILFDAREAFNLDAFAMAAGTLKAGGCLVLWLDKYGQIDLDSLRWSGESQGISTPNFQYHLNKLIQKYQPFFNVVSESSACLQFQHKQANPAQARIIEQVLSLQQEVFIITAKRGRGKSALAGLLANQLGQHQPNLRLWLTAPNKSAVQILQDFAEPQLSFIAPDLLLVQIEQQPNRFNQDLLFIDEAAMIPLAMLNQLVDAFRYVVLTTTIHSYEGTGRGFLLKFLANLARDYQHFELNQPLRWAENDPLENFVDELLLIDCEDRFRQIPFEVASAVNFRQVSQQQIISRIDDFYGLLTLAHYRTSPLDLRRLFDAPKQQFWLAEQAEHLIGGAWLVQEGGFQDKQLIDDICCGQRRPKGNLAVQKLAADYMQPKFCELHSLRISRIAVQPNWQNHQIGQRLIHQICENSKVDFISVSFGYSPELAYFWQKCGFILLSLGYKKEASSGCYSAIALRAISTQAEKLVEQTRLSFIADFSLTFHPLIHQFDFVPRLQFIEQDRVYLQNFVKNNRSLYMSLPSIQRALILFRDKFQSLPDFFTDFELNIEQFSTKKSWVQQCRLEIENLLKYI